MRLIRVLLFMLVVLSLPVSDEKQIISCKPTYTIMKKQTTMISRFYQKYIQIDCRMLSRHSYVQSSFAAIYANAASRKAYEPYTESQPTKSASRPIAGCCYEVRCVVTSSLISQSGNDSFRWGLILCWRLFCRSLKRAAHPNFHTRQKMTKCCQRTPTGDGNFS